MDHFLFPVSPDALARCAIKNLLDNIPVLTVCPIRTKDSDLINEDDLARIEAFELDVLIRLGTRTLLGRILHCARFGVWSYHQGDSGVNRGGPEGFWEVLLGLQETGSTLQILGEGGDSGPVLYQSCAQTHFLSVRRNNNSVHWKSMSFLPRKLEQLHRIGGDAFLARIREENAQPSFYSGRPCAMPGNAELAPVLLRHFLRYAAIKLQWLFYLDQWCLLVSSGVPGLISTTLWKFRQIIPPKDRFWADPYLVHKDGKYFVFIEELIYAQGKGHISYIVMDESGNHSEPKQIIERPYHLSYPFLFEYGGETYMIPESSANKTIELYRCVRFPDEWEFDHVLMADVMAVDTTLYLADGLWWMFVGIQENAGASLNEELFVYSATNPVNGEWKPHPSNPVVSDIKSARPAGRIFEQGGRLYRPSQDCSRGYGYGLRINRIETLTPTDYREVYVTEIEPKWDPAFKAVHTLSFQGSLTVLDGVKRRRRYF